MIFIFLSNTYFFHCASRVDGEAPLVDCPVVGHKKEGNKLFQHPVSQMGMRQVFVQMGLSLLEFL